MRDEMVEINGQRLHVTDTGGQGAVLLIAHVSSRYLVTEVASHLGTSNGSAGQVVDQATERHMPWRTHQQLAERPTATSYERAATHRFQR
jgi:hypothetical protein